MGLFGERRTKKTYLDSNGYFRFKDSDRLVHRYVAYKHIYTKGNFRYSFGDYDVHHRNGNKRDNRVENLQLLLRDQHKWVHADPISKLFIWIFKGKPRDPET